MNIRNILASFGVIVFLTGIISGAEIDERVKPGEMFTIDFPDLPKTRTNEVAQMQVRIPDEYDPNKSYPLIVWLEGGDGSSSCWTCFSLVDRSKFICVGLSYPLGCNSPKQSNMVGNPSKLWTFHKTMLDKLHEIVPNINPAIKIIAGFSNGGHAIDCYFSLNGEKHKEFYDMFNCYLLADGGGFSGGRYSGYNGRYLFGCWGEKSPNRDNVRKLVNNAKSKGVICTGYEMANTGHEFSEDGKKEARKWISEVVIPGTLQNSLKTVRKLAKKTKTQSDAMLLAKGSLLFTEKEKEIQYLQDIIEEINNKAKTDYEVLSTQTKGVEYTKISIKSIIRKYEKFIKKWNGSASALAAANDLKILYEKQNALKVDG